jgi:hypothetical protein
MNVTNAREIAKLDSAMEVLLPSLRAALQACQRLKELETASKPEDYSKVVFTIALGTLVQGASQLPLASLHLLTGLTAALMDFEIYPDEDEKEKAQQRLQA